MIITKPNTKRVTTAKTREIAVATLYASVLPSAIQIAMIITQIESIVTLHCIVYVIHEANLLSSAIWRMFLSQLFSDVSALIGTVNVMYMYIYMIVYVHACIGIEFE